LHALAKTMFLKLPTGTHTANDHAMDQMYAAGSLANAGAKSGDNGGSLPKSVIEWRGTDERHVRSIGPDGFMMSSQCLEVLEKRAVMYT